MSITVCICVKTISFPRGGGHKWVYLNWALGMRAHGCRVIWIEAISPKDTSGDLDARISDLNQQLRSYGLADCLPLHCGEMNESAPQLSDEVKAPWRKVARDSDLILNFVYALPQVIVSCFQRSALVDIDPGQLQIWISKGLLHVARYDRYFTIGETVGQPGALFPDCGIEWYYTPPCVALDWWPPVQAIETSAFTTVSQWIASEWVEDEHGVYAKNDKRTGFQPYIDLPRNTDQRLELAICIGHSVEDSNEYNLLRKHGWSVRRSFEVASKPEDYQKYIQSSRGEFTCVKPSCIRYQNAWISDRTLCYLASAKPAVVQYTGPSGFLPNAAGIFRFRDIEEAISCLNMATDNYYDQCQIARELAETYFDARKVAFAVLERALR